MYFSDPVLFEIPVRPLVQKLLHIRYAQGLVATPDQTGLPLYIWAMAQSEKVMLYTGKDRKGNRRFNPESLTARIGVGIQEFHAYRHQHLFNHAELMVLDAMAGHMIRQDFIQFVEASEHPPMQALRNWTDRYDFSDDDLAETNLKQILMRHRRNQGETPFTVVRPLQSSPIQKAA